MNNHQPGLQDGWPIDDGGNILLTREVAQSMAEAGATWVRVNFRLGRRYPSWNWVAPLDRSTALMRYQQIVANLRSANLKVLGLLSNETGRGNQEEWQQNAAERVRGASGGNPFLEGFAQGTARLVQIFAGQVDAWEVWNEPNTWTQQAPDGGYVGGSYIYPSNFAWLVNRLSSELQTLGITGIPLLSGGLFAHDGTMADDYLRATFERGGWCKRTALPVQGIGYHLYIDQGGAVSTQKINRYLDSIRKVVRSYGCGDVPFWLTEVGWNTNSISEDVQAANLRTLYRVCTSRTDILSTFWFQRIDIPPANLAFGLLRDDGSRKPAWSAYRDLKSGTSG